MRRLGRVLSLLVGAALSAGVIRAEIVELADPDLPAEVVVHVAYATITVRGSERSDVALDVVEADAEGVGTVHLPLRANGNRVEILHPGNDVPLALRLEVPRRSDLSVTSSNGGAIEIEGVDGDLEVVNSNAPVILSAIRGSAIVSTSNGEIVADFRRVDPSGTVSLFTSNHFITVALPPDFEGRVLAETDTGPIESDFEIETLPRPQGGPRRPGRLLAGSIGGGDGPLMRLRTENARIRISKAQVE